MSICLVGVSSRGSLMFCRNCGMIVQREQAQPLAAHAEAPVRDAARAHRVGGFAFEGLDDRRPSATIWFGIFVQIAVFDQVGHQRMQPVDGNEFFGKVERRAEVIHAAVDVIGIGDVVVRDSAAQPEDARAGGKARSTTACLLAHLRLPKPCTTTSDSAFETSGSPVPSRPFQLAFMPL